MLPITLKLNFPSSHSLFADVVSAGKDIQDNFKSLLNPGIQPVQMQVRNFDSAADCVFLHCLCWHSLDPASSLPASPTPPMHRSSAVSNAQVVAAIAFCDSCKVSSKLAVLHP